MKEAKKTIYGEKMKEHDCPLCFRGIPNNEKRGEYIGALSRYDNETYVCSQCGSFEGWVELEKGQRRNIKANKGKYTWRDWRALVLDQQYKVAVELDTNMENILNIKDESHGLSR